MNEAASNKQSQLDQILKYFKFINDEIRTVECKEFNVEQCKFEK